MRIRSLASWLACGAILVSPAAFSDGPNIASVLKPVKFKSFEILVSGDNAGCDGIQICAGFFARFYDDNNGALQSNIATYYFSPTYSQFINCVGPAYVNALTVDEKTWKFTINATLDTFNNIACDASHPDAVVLNISGMPDGKYIDSSSGKGITTTDITILKYTRQHTFVEEAATGNNGYFNGAYPNSNVEVTRKTEMTKAP